MAERAPRSPLPFLAGTGIAGAVLVILELAVMIWVVGQIGWWTLLAILATSLVGLGTLGVVGKKSYDQLRSAIQSEDPRSLTGASNGLAFAGGLLMLMPGFVTDLVGFLMIIPITRPIFRQLGSWYVRKMTKPIVGDDYPASSKVVKGEVVEEETRADDGPRVIEGTVIDDDRGPRT